MNIIRKTNVASVLSGFSKIVKQLEDIANREAAAASGKADLMLKVGHEINEHQAERTRALNAAKKIEGLLS